uniref:Exostosin GT47 domain-containing protein n=1 Tax=Haptolina brevifila TaxID=156173 RepID=A0A7S2BTF8_9EUKA|mmetsp:Transcript_16504/g.33176  ORF Transcript_16504/g.33176 Transcript_16504/m.33176 type:complete len:517 (+) Transcript_16504:1012-2562(+)
MAHYVRSAFPYWERSGGRDHVFLVPSDAGSCWFDGELGAHPIFVTHWGLLGSHSAMKKTSGRQHDFDDKAKVLSKMRNAHFCFSPHKDVVAPAFAGGSDGGRAILQGSAPDPERPADPSIQLLHAGGIWQWKNYKPANNSEPWYSQGVRQELYRQFGGAGGTAAGIVIRAHGVPREEWLKAKFCLSASGMGWGIRTAMLLLLGCTPLIIQPYVVQPLEEVLPYPSFTLRHDVFEELPHLPTRLRSISQSEVGAMRRQGQLLKAAFSWSRHGGLAYNYTILWLCQRAVQLRGRLKSDPVVASASNKAAGVPGDAHCAVHAAGLPAATATARKLAWLPASVVDARGQLIQERREAVAKLESDRVLAEVVTTAHENGAGGSAAPAAAAIETVGEEEPREVAPQTFRFTNLLPVAGCMSGFCNVTTGSKSCDTDSMGMWPVGVRRSSPVRGGIWSIDDCLAACRRCRQCRFISFSASPAHQDCSWYSSCDMARLFPPPREGPDYQTCNIHQMVHRPPLPQ